MTAKKYEKLDNSLKVWIGILLSIFTLSLHAAPIELDETCVVSVLNRTVQASADGSWSLDNVPTFMGQVRARATCVRNGQTISGQTDYFTIPANGNVVVGDFNEVENEPVPENIAFLSGNNAVLYGEQTYYRLRVIADYEDGRRVDITRRSSGINYSVSNPSIASIDDNGVLRGLASGRVLITARKDGVAAILALTVVTTGDQDEDGLPDDFERANGLDANDPVDALEDGDGDGVSALNEYLAGTDINNPDTDGDGLSDGEEVAAGADGFVTNPLLADSDSDGISDSLEVAVGSDPTDINDYNLADSIQGISVDPSAIVLTYNTVVNQDTSAQLTVRGETLDGTNVDITRRDKGTNYASSDLNICNFGGRDGEVFAGQNGDCVVTASNSGFSADADIEVRSFAPTSVSAVSVVDQAYNVDVSGDYAFVATGNGMRVMDIADRNNPVEVGTLLVGTQINDIKVRGDYAYLAADAAGLLVVDVTYPDTPVLIGRLAYGGDAKDLQLYRDYALIAANDRGIIVADISNPELPLFVNEVPTNGNAIGVSWTQDGQVAVVALEGSGIELFEFPLTSTPISRASLNVSGSVQDVEIKGDYAYLANYNRGLVVVDISDLANPVETGATNTTNVRNNRDIAIVGNFAILADGFTAGSNGAAIVDISDPAVPSARRILGLSAGGSSYGIAIDSEYIYVSSTGGFSIGQYVEFVDDNTIPPTVEITSPLIGDTALEGGALFSTVEARDDIGVSQVQYFVNGNIVATDYVAPFESLVPMPAGVAEAELFARAIDFGGNTTDSDVVTIQLIADSDLDGLSDSDELEVHGTSPYLPDSDNDGLQDRYEMDLGLNPLLRDEDQDGLVDGEEINIGEDGYVTDPKDADSDDDNLPDGYEVQYGLNPNDPSDALLDPDEDGLTTYEEFLAGSDPTSSDSDLDGMPDAYERLYGLDPDDPSDAYADLDEDGVPNIVEYNEQTDPTNPDIMAPQVAFVAPFDGDLVPVSTLLLVRFDEPLLASSVNVDSVRLFDSEGAEFDGVVTLSSDGFLLTFNPTLYLPALSDYELRVNGVRDIAGNPLSQEYVLAVSTSDQADTAGPVVSFSNPADNASNVPTNTTFSITLNEYIDPTTLFSNNVYLRDVTSNTTVPGTVGITEEGNEIYFIPDNELLVARNYQLRVENIRDLSGNNCSNCYGVRYLDFTTGFESDEVAPQILNTSIADGQTELPTNSRIRILFDEPVDGKSVYNVALYLNEEKVQTNVGLNSSRNILTLTPVAELNTTTEYRVVIESVLDRSGNELTSSSELRFTTGSGSDTAQGSLVSHSPYADRSNVPLNTLVSIRVSESIDPLSLSNSSVRLYNQTTRKYEYGTHELTENNTRITFTPYEALKPYSDYQLRISDNSSRSLLDYAGNRVSYGQYRYFSTAEKTLEKEANVYLVNIENDTQEVPVNTRFAVWFDEYLDPVCARDAVLEVSDGVTTTNHPVSFNGTTHVYAYELGLEASTAYTLTLNGLCDYAGAVVPPYTMSFTTRDDATEDTAYPRIVSITPSDRSTNVALDSQIVMTFDEAIQAYQGSAIRVETYEGGWTYIPGSTEIQGNVATFTPEDGFPPNQEIRVRLYRVRDYADNYYTGNWYYYFTTASGSENVAPQVVSVTPEDGSMDIAPGMPITVTFSEALNPSTVNNNNFVFWANGSLIRPSVYRSSDSQRVTLEANLPHGAPVALVVTSDVQDLSGNHLTDYTSMFTTGVVSTETSRPSIVNQYPNGNNVHPKYAGRVVLYANESMDASTLANAVKVVQNGQLVTGTVEALADAQAIEFIPDEPFEEGAYIQVFVTTAARDLNGNALYSYQGNFVMRNLPGEAIGTAPTLVSYRPSNWTTIDTLNPRIRAQFSEELDAGSVDESAVVLMNRNTGVVIPVTVEHSRADMISVTPNELLEAGGYYRIQYVSNTLTDTDGDQLASHTYHYFNTSSNASEDTSAPNLLFLSPPDGSTDVPLNAPIHAIYDEVIDPWSYYSSELHQSGGVNLSFGSSGRELRYQKLDVLLPEDTEITETLPALEDMSGNVGTEASTRFTTASNLDLTRPSVVNHSPVANATGVPSNAVISIEMNDVIDPASINSSSVRLYDTELRQYVSISRSLDTNGRTIVIVPNEALAAGRRYYANTNGVKDLAGNSSYSQSVYFTVGYEEDTAAPEVSATSIVDGQVDVPRNARVRIRFSEAINGSTLDEGSKIVVTDAVGAEVPYKWSMSSNHSEVTLIPRTVLAADASYTVTIQNVEDRADNVMENTYQISFTTGDRIFVNEDGYSRVSPLNQFSGIGINSPIEVLFNRRVDRTTVDNNTFYVYKYSDGSRLNGSFSFSDDDHRVMFTPNEPFEINQRYNVRVSYYHNPGQTYIRDLAGNRLAYTTDYNRYYFTTGDGEDTLAPELLEVGIPDGAEQIPLNARISFRFSEPVNATRIDSMIKLYDESDNEVAYTWSMDSSGKVVFLSPTGGMNAIETYRYEVSVEDMAGNETTDRTFGSFITGDSEDTSEGTYVRTSPFDEFSNVPINAAIEILFNERIDRSTVDNNTFYVYKYSDGSRIYGSFSFSEDDRRVTFTPNESFETNQRYNVRVGYYRNPGQTYIRDLAGNRLAYTTDYNRYYFTTGSSEDLVAPELLEVGIPDGTNDVPLNARISFRFSEPVNATRVDNMIQLLDESNSLIDYVWSTDESGRAVFVTPTSELLSFSTYRYELGNVFDAVLNDSDLNIDSSFFTGSESDDFESGIITLSPANTESGVLTNAIIEVGFSERVDRTTVTNNTFYVYKYSDGSRVYGSFIFSEESNNVSFVPNEALDINERYQVRVSYYRNPGQRYIRDLAGNILAYTTNSNRYYFYTGAQ